jgi:Gas vesicle protein K/Gas vesicle protein
VSPIPTDPPDEGASSLLEVVDRLLNRGVVATGDVVLGLAGVDLIYLRLSALLCAADRLLGKREEPAAVPPLASPLPLAAGIEGIKSAERATVPAPAERGRVEEAGGGSPPPPPRQEAPEEVPRWLVTEPGEAVDLAPAGAPRWNADPEDASRAVAKLVLTLVDFVRQLLERQAIRRMEAETLTPEEVEGIGLALLRLEETLAEMARKFGLDPKDLNLDLGPLGRLT